MTARHSRCFLKRVGNRPRRNLLHDPSHFVRYASGEVWQTSPGCARSCGAGIFDDQVASRSTGTWASIVSRNLRNSCARCRAGRTADVSVTAMAPSCRLSGQQHRKSSAIVLVAVIDLQYASDLRGKCRDQAHSQPVASRWIEPFRQGGTFVANR
jgi:hypothetical protein